MKPEDWVDRERREGQAIVRLPENEIRVAMPAEIAEVCGRSLLRSRRVRVRNEDGLECVLQEGDTLWLCKTFRPPVDLDRLCAEADPGGLR